MTRPSGDLLARYDAQIHPCPRCDNRIIGDRSCGVCAILTVTAVPVAAA